MAAPPPDAVDSEPPPDHRALYRNITRNFTGVYLTMLSIIQGVALTSLAGVALGAGGRFTLLNWIEVATMLWTLIYVWNHFMADALVARWIPDLEDATILFGTGVFELVANQAIVWTPAAWLTTLALLFLAWSAATFYIRGNQERVVRDPIRLDLLRRRPWNFIDTFARIGSDDGHHARRVDPLAYIHLHGGFSC